MERLKNEFDEKGDADLQDGEDVMAVAGLLKLFLRELPQSLIPEADTQHFLHIQQSKPSHPLLNHCIL